MQRSTAQKISDATASNSNPYFPSEVTSSLTSLNERTRLPAIPAPCQACGGSRGPRMPICDGCGAQVNDAHIRQRIERLEMATRFRPVHISVLLIDAAPPARFEDYFYRATSDRAERSPASRAYFDGLVKCAGAGPGPGM